MIIAILYSTFYYHHHKSMKFSFHRKSRNMVKHQFNLHNNQHSKISITLGYTLINFQIVQTSIKFHGFPLINSTHFPSKIPKINSMAVPSLDLQLNYSTSPDYQKPEKIIPIKFSLSRNIFIFFPSLALLRNSKKNHRKGK